MTGEGGAIRHYFVGLDTPAYSSFIFFANSKYNCKNLKILNGQYGYILNVLKSE